MKRLVVVSALCTMAVLLWSGSLSAQEQRGTVVIPKSSIFRPEDAGIRAHTNVQLFYPGGVIPDSANPTGETPSSLGCVYGIVPDPQPGCPKDGTSNPTGGQHIIAIVDAYHYPNAESDLAVFSTTFGLPQAKFKQIHAGPVVPTEDCGWEVEEALDIEWAHAMAPDAMIVLVEGQSNTYGKLLSAVDRAGRFIAAHGGKGEVTMSWSSGEFHREKIFDDHFKQPGIVYFASSGDTGGVVQYPAASPYIVSVGGTRVNRSNGNFTNEIGWSGSGGGSSVFEKRPPFQDGIKNIVGGFRGIPDLSYDADPASGASVYQTSAMCGSHQWFVVGGTSLSSPATAGFVNAAHKFKSGSPQENTLIYKNLGNADDFTDIISGRAGQFTAGPGWDFVTGVGTPLGYGGK